MSYEIIWDKKVLNFLNKLELFTSQRIIQFVKDFSKNPRTKQFKKLRGEKLFRLRAGDYRVFFDFNSKAKTIQILEIGHRKNIYKR